MRVQTIHREANAWPVEFEDDYTGEPRVMWHIEDEDGRTLIDDETFKKTWEEVD